MRKLLIVLAAFAFVIAYTVPTLAADWSFYGSARMSTFYDSVTEEASATGFDDGDTTWSQQGNSRLGATVKAGKIGGGFEYGTGINLRKLYGTYNFGGIQLLLGQTYTPVNMFYSNQVWGGDTDMLKFGGVYDGRRGMIQLKIKGFKIALIEPSTGAVTTPAETDTTIPKIEAAYALKAGPATIDFQGGYNSYDEVDAADSEETISSYFLGVGVKLAFGAFYVRGNAYTGQNLGPYGLWQEGDDDPALIAGDVENNTSIGYLLVVGFRVSDTLKLEGGYGGNQHDRDDFATQDDTSALYVQAVLNISPGFFIVPEIGYIDFGDSSAEVDQGSQTYFGAKWQINF